MRAPAYGALNRIALDGSTSSQGHHFEGLNSLDWPPVDVRAPLCAARHRKEHLFTVGNSMKYNHLQRSPLHETTPPARRPQSALRRACWFIYTPNIIVYKDLCQNLQTPALSPFARLRRRLAPRIGRRDSAFSGPNAARLLVHVCLTMKRAANDGNLPSREADCSLRARHDPGLESWSH